ncbi:PadR family transcriptional regulator [Hyphococcus sp.]|jgi:PadR family transcriptional regulator PadR|uniref:PadR family transcriptional regulator n=1 Tax=Hyphococcus sp. TaxID=2038636 RepID=UPI003D0FBEB7
MARAETNWETQMRKGLSEYFVMLVLAASPAHGYKIASDLRELEIFDMGEGTLYPLLARLTARGFIKPAWATDGPGAARKVYSLTSQGRRELSRMKALWRKLNDSQNLLGG